MARRSARYASDRFPPYVRVAQRVKNAAVTVAKLKKQGQVIEPVAIAGKAIASTFWGKAWCTHLESLSDFENRLPRGRTYVRRGAVVHLALDSGRIVAKVQGSSLYDIEIVIAKLKPQRWTKVVATCTGSIDSLVELLRGKLSESVMSAVTNVDTGLFPAASEIRMSCSCPDWAGLCKHLAAVLYGVGARLDARPELLFTLRGVDPSELVAERAVVPIPGAKPRGKHSRQVLSNSALSDVFGIELEPAAPKRTSAAKSAARSAQTTRVPASRAAVPRTPAPVAKRRSSSSADDVALRGALVLEFIKSHSGLGVELIGKHLGFSTAQLSLPIRKLIVAGSVVTAGTGRARKYFAAARPTLESRKRRAT